MSAQGEPTGLRHNQEKNELKELFEPLRDDWELTSETITTLGEALNHFATERAVPDDTQAEVMQKLWQQVEQELAEVTATVEKLAAEHASLAEFLEKWELTSETITTLGEALNHFATERAVPDDTQAEVMQKLWQQVERSLQEVTIEIGGAEAEETLEEPPEAKRLYADAYPEQNFVRLESSIDNPIDEKSVFRGIVGKEVAPRILHPIPIEGTMSFALLTPNEDGHWQYFSLNTLGQVEFVDNKNQAISMGEQQLFEEFDSYVPNYAHRKEVRRIIQEYSGQLTARTTIGNPEEGPQHLEARFIDAKLDTHQVSIAISQEALVRNTPHTEDLRGNVELLDGTSVNIDRIMAIVEPTSQSPLYEKNFEVDSLHVEPGNVVSPEESKLEVSPDEAAPEPVEDINQFERLNPSITFIKTSDIRPGDLIALRTSPYTYAWAESAPEEQGGQLTTKVRELDRTTGQWNETVWDKGRTLRAVRRLREDEQQASVLAVEKKYNHLEPLGSRSADTLLYGSVLYNTTRQEYYLISEIDSFDVKAMRLPKVGRFAGTWTLGQTIKKDELASEEWRIDTESEARLKTISPNSPEFPYRDIADAEPLSYVPITNNAQVEPGMLVLGFSSAEDFEEQGFFTQIGAWMVVDKRDEKLDDRCCIASEYVGPKEWGGLWPVSFSVPNREGVVYYAAKADVPPNPEEVKKRAERALLEKHQGRINVAAEKNGKYLSDTPENAELRLALAKAIDAHEDLDTSTWLPVLMYMKENGRNSEIMQSLLLTYRNLSDTRAGLRADRRELAAASVVLYHVRNGGEGDLSESIVSQGRGLIGKLVESGQFAELDKPELRYEPGSDERLIANHAEALTQMAETSSQKVELEKPFVKVAVSLALESGFNPKSLVAFITFAASEPSPGRETVITVLDIARATLATVPAEKRQNILEHFAVLKDALALKSVETLQGAYTNEPGTPQLHYIDTRKILLTLSQNKKYGYLQGWLAEQDRVRAAADEAQRHEQEQRIAELPKTILEPSSFHSIAEGEQIALNAGDILYHPQRNLMLKLEEQHVTATGIATGRWKTKTLARGAAEKDVLALDKNKLLEYQAYNGTLEDLQTETTLHIDELFPKEKFAETITDTTPLEATYIIGRHEEETQIFRLIREEENGQWACDGLNSSFGIWESGWVIPRSVMSQFKIFRSAPSDENPDASNGPAGPGPSEIKPSDETQTTIDEPSSFREMTERYAAVIDRIREAAATNQELSNGLDSTDRLYYAVCASCRGYSAEAIGRSIEHVHVATDRDPEPLRVERVKEMLAIADAIREILEENTDFSAMTTPYEAGWDIPDRALFYASNANWDKVVSVQDKAVENTGREARYTLQLLNQGHFKNTPIEKHYLDFMRDGGTREGYLADLTSRRENGLLGPRFARLVLEKLHAPLPAATVEGWTIEPVETLREQHSKLIEALHGTYPDLQDPLVEEALLRQLSPGENLNYADSIATLKDYLYYVKRERPSSDDLVRHKHMADAFRHMSAYGIRSSAEAYAKIISGWDNPLRIGRRLQVQRAKYHPPTNSQIDQNPDLAIEQWIRNEDWRAVGLLHQLHYPEPVEPSPTVALPKQLEKINPPTLNAGLLKPIDGIPAVGSIARIPGPDKYGHLDLGLAQRDDEGRGWYAFPYLRHQKKWAQDAEWFPDEALIGNGVEFGIIETEALETQPTYPELENVEPVQPLFKSDYFQEVEVNNLHEGLTNRQLGEGLILATTQGTELSIWRVEEIDYNKEYDVFYLRSRLLDAYGRPHYSASESLVVTKTASPQLPYYRLYSDPSNSEKHSIGTEELADYEAQQVTEILDKHLDHYALALQIPKNTFITPGGDKDLGSSEEADDTPAQLTLRLSNTPNSIRKGYVNELYSDPDMGQFFDTSPAIYGPINKTLRDMVRQDEQEHLNEEQLLRRAKVVIAKDPLSPDSNMRILQIQFTSSQLSSVGRPTPTRLVLALPSSQAEYLYLYLRRHRYNDEHQAAESIRKVLGALDKHLPKVAPVYQDTVIRTGSTYDLPSEDELHITSRK